LTPHLERLPSQVEQRAFTDEIVARYLEIVPPTQQASYATYVYVCATMIATST